MRKFTTVASATALSLIVTGSVVGTAYAWHPQGQITKSVTNITAGGAISDANTAAAAVNAKPGDELRYTITVKNPAPAADKHYNDLAFVKVVDQLPAGVEQVANPGQRTITADLGTILPGKSVTKTYAVKVTETTNGKVVTNEACFFGDSVVKDKPLTGCDKAVIKVVNPVVVTPPVVTPPVTPEPETPGVGGGEEAPEELPNVGSGIIAPIAGLATAVSGYGAHLFVSKRRKS